MRRVDTMLGATSLLELLESPKWQPEPAPLELPDSKRPRTSEMPQLMARDTSSGSSITTEFDLSAADDDIATPALGAGILSSPDADGPMNISETLTLSPLLLPMALTPDELQSLPDLDLLSTPDTTEAMAEADESDDLHWLALKVACSETMKRPQSKTEDPAVGMRHRRWLAKLRASLHSGSDALTRKLLTPALSSDPERTMKTLAHLSPRQVSTTTCVKGTPERAGLTLTHLTAAGGRSPAQGCPRAGAGATLDRTTTASHNSRTNLLCCLVSKALQMRDPPPLVWTCGRHVRLEGRRG